MYGKIHKLSVDLSSIVMVLSYGRRAIYRDVYVASHHCAVCTYWQCLILITCCTFPLTWSESIFSFRNNLSLLAAAAPMAAVAHLIGGACVACTLCRWRTEEEDEEKEERNSICVWLDALRIDSAQFDIRFIHFYFSLTVVHSALPQRQFIKRYHKGKCLLFIWNSHFSCGWSHWLLLSNSIVKCEWTCALTIQITFSLIFRPVPSIRFDLYFFFISSIAGYDVPEWTYTMIN